MRGQPALMDDMTLIAWVVVGAVIIGLIGLVRLAIWWENRRVVTSREDPVTSAVAGGTSTGHGSKDVTV